MSTNPGIAEEPVSAEVAKVVDEQKHALDKLRDSINDRALQTAGRAEGAALVVSHQLTELGAQLGGRVAVLEDKQRDAGAELKAIRAAVDATKTSVDALLARSPVQQALYALTALVVLSYFGSLLWDRFLGAGAG